MVSRRLAFEVTSRASVSAVCFSRRSLHLVSASEPMNGGYEDYLMTSGSSSSNVWFRMGVEEQAGCGAKVGV